MKIFFVNDFENVGEKEGDIGERGRTFCPEELVPGEDGFEVVEDVFGVEVDVGLALSPDLIDGD